MDIGEKALGIIRLALAEDLGVEGDITTAAACPPDASGKAIIISRGPCRIAGGPIAQRVFSLAADGAAYTALVGDGENAAPGQNIARIEGSLRAILAGERTALNFLGHLCGIATLTSRLVEIAEPYGVKIMDTRKTSPGMRPLEKYAVAMGGGTNHREGLFDGIIIKDNHIAAAGGLEIAVRRVRNSYGDRFPIEVEAATLAEVREAVDSGADIIMLDNMDPETAKSAVAIIGGRARTEVSGGVTPENLVTYVALGADAISLGFITHSAPSADLSLELDVG
ncbi:MAG: carboxylating nicotinate-nucleotide diphosphorylase [Candidatus Geothermincolia bacterium]